MSWIGTGIGALLGSRNGGILGAIIGAVIGNWLEEKAKVLVKDSDSGQRPATEGELATLAAIAAMLAKLAKADGRITEDEIHFCERCFTRLGFFGEKREYCIRIFREAKNDGHTIYEYAQSFAAAQPNSRIREIVYGILWDLADADGVIAPEEMEILRQIVSFLRIDPSLFVWECRQRGCWDARSNSGQRETPESDPYEVLGCSRSATNEEVRKAYREKVKQLHPDVLRAQGLSDELIAKANDQMARLNAAWNEIKQQRGL
ncbi:MAG: TerB family tellurite resistance protein [Kiritimatiellae bacterium]|nr:TerB family tellurite resistance protein [Kiritimatiellia bacterium]